MVARCKRTRPILMASSDIKSSTETKTLILEGKNQLRKLLEEELNRRLDAIRGYLQAADRDPHLSLEEIFRRGHKKRLWSIGRLSSWRGRAEAPPSADEV